MPRNNLLMIGILLLVTSPCLAGSLWLNGNDLYSRNGSKDFKPGDIITVKISEETTAQSKATTNTQDDSQVEITTGPKIPFFKKVVDRFIGNNEIKNTWKGDGTTTRSGKLAGTVTATVLEVLPNGNLLLEGSRSMRVNRENQTLKVRGVARPRDIDAANTIDSKLLADANIRFEGKGSVGRLQRPGLMTKIVNFVF